MKKASIALLSALMFIQVAIYGTFNPVISMYLKDFLGFTGEQAGAILSLSVLASVFAPLLAAFITDRLIPTKYMLIICHGLSAGVALLLRQQQSYQMVLVLYLTYLFTLGPTIGLLNTLIFRHLEGRREKFGFVRMWGTLGWVAIAWVFGTLYMKLWGKGDPALLGDLFLFGAILSGVLMIASIFLPRAPRTGEKFQGWQTLFPREAFQVIMRPEMLGMILVFFLSSVMDKFYMFGGAPYLAARGFATADIPPILTLGQALEVFALLGMSWVLKKIGFKLSFLIGLAFQVGRYALLAYLPQKGFILTALTFNGFIYAFFYAASTVYVDSLCDEKSRAGVHQLINTIFFGLSGLVGNYLAGSLMDRYEAAAGIEYRSFWTIPLIISVVVTVLAIILIKDRPVEEANTSLKEQEDCPDCPREAL